MSIVENFAEYVSVLDIQRIYEKLCAVMQCNVKCGYYPSRESVCIYI